MWQSQSAASARGQPFFACEMLRYHASCGRCHRAAPAAPLRCDALSTALLHHYFYKCRVLAAQKKWRERTQRRRKRLARTATSIRVVGGVRRARRPGCATSTPPAVALRTISAAADAVALEATADRISGTTSSGRWRRRHLRPRAPHRPYPNERQTIV